MIEHWMIMDCRQYLPWWQLPVCWVDTAWHSIIDRLTEHDDWLICRLHDRLLARGMAAEYMAKIRGGK